MKKKNQRKKYKNLLSYFDSQIKVYIMNQLQYNSKRIIKKQLSLLWK